MIILVLNNGSSSLKFQLVALTEGEERVLALGQVERIGGEAVISLRTGAQSSKHTAPLRDTTSALHYMLKKLQDRREDLDGFKGPQDISAVGHRVVHGGERFLASVLITPEVMAELEDNIELAPLHNPANLKGIRAMWEILGEDRPQVAVFDTAFHASIPEKAWLYALPYSMYRRHKVRRYGFHGTSYAYVLRRYQELTGASESASNLIIFHLGNGCSAVAIKEGRSIDTSMGMTPTEGLVMGSRSGDVDPSVIEMIATKEGLSFSEMQAVLNRNSGLLGISGITSDMRDLLAEADEHQDRRALLAIDIFCYRARKYLGAYLAAIGPIQAVLFCGGIGENSPHIRQGILDGLDHLGIHLDAARNDNVPSDGLISKPKSPIEVRVIPTNEEIMIVRETLRLVKGRASA
jgi:acetate kinase